MNIIKTIPWNIAPGGNIVLTYVGLGTGLLLISSDTLNTGTLRQKTITLQTTNPGNKASVTITVRQKGFQALKDSENDISLILE